MKILSFTATTLLFYITGLAQTNPQQKDSIKQQTEQLKEVIVTGNVLLGSKFEAQNKTGSATYISKEDLKKFSFTNINRILRTVPGINIYEETMIQETPNWH